MFQVDSATAATTFPEPAAVGPNPGGFFTSGTPGVVGATVVDPDIMNAMMLEICNAVVSSGQTLSKTNQSQLSQALKGRLLNVRVFVSSGTYIPTTGANTADVLAIGGGGSGGGAPASGSTTASLGSGGTAGSAGRGLYVITGPVSITVGSGGTANTGNSGNQGGTSSYGTALTAPGGPGGQHEGPTTPVFASGGVNGALSTGGTVFNTDGQPGGLSFAFTSSGLGGAGGASILGGGGAATTGNNTGTNGTSPGSGGGGTCSLNGNGALAGGSGSNGTVIILEYS
jgi:hypothetical protein